MHSASAAAHYATLLSVSILVFSETESKWLNQPYASLIYWPHYKLFHFNYRGKQKFTSIPVDQCDYQVGTQKRKREIVVGCELNAHVENMSQCSIG